MKLVKPVRTTDCVFLIRTRGPRATWCALHEMPRGDLSRTQVLAFVSEADAEVWAYGLEEYRREHGQWPAREISKQTTSLEWVGGRPDRPAALEHLDIVKMTLATTMSMLMGTSASCRLIHDPYNLARRTDLDQKFDKAAVCSRLECDYTMPHAEAKDVQ